MSQRKALYQWSQEIARQVPCLSKPQAFVLAAFSLGIALSRRCNLGIVAEALACLGKADTVERRLQRFLSNERLLCEECSWFLARWVLWSLRPPGLVVLLVDETSLKERLKVMAVSLAYRGRAIPLAWWCYRQEDWPMGQVKLVTTLLRQVSKGLRSGSTVLVQADRGIGTSPELLKAVQSMGWYFLVRVQGHTRVLLEDGRELPFSSLVPRPGRGWKGSVWAFKKRGWLPCWAVGRWDPRYREPWLLLTNWPTAQGSWYGLRMWQEVAFRDFKSTGWQWQRSRVWDPQRASRLWLVMALAYVWAISMGTLVICTKGLRREVMRGKGWRHSVFQLGLRLLKRWFQLRRPLFYHLVLIPHVPVFPKSVVQ